MKQRLFLCLLFVISINSHSQTVRGTPEQHASCYANFLLIAGSLQKKEPSSAEEAKMIAKKFDALATSKLDDKKFDLIVNQEASNYKKSFQELGEGNFLKMMRKKLDDCRQLIK